MYVGTLCYLESTSGLPQRLPKSSVLDLCGGSFCSRIYHAFVTTAPAIRFAGHIPLGKLADAELHFAGGANPMA